MAKEKKAGAGRKEKKEKYFRVKRLKGWFFPYRTFLKRELYLSDGGKFTISLHFNKYGLSLMIGQPSGDPTRVMLKPKKKGSGSYGNS